MTHASIMAQPVNAWLCLQVRILAKAVSLHLSA